MSKNKFGATNGEGREKLGSRLGFILISAGCAIGVGNVWRFPTMAGQYGGAIFVLFYLVFLVLLGIPVMTIEFSLGRAAQASPVLLYKKLEPENTKWHLHGYAALAGNLLLMMFYTSVTGWIVQYFIYMVGGKFEGLTSIQIDGVFGEMLSNPWGLIAFMGGVVLVGFLVNSFNMQKGFERISKIMMLALLVLIAVLAVNSFTLSGAAEGLSFYLVPNWSNVEKTEGGLLTVIVQAMNQAFFTLSLGIGSMAIFGSFIGKDRSLLGESVIITVLDTFVAITAGLIIFPACFTYDVNVDGGPPLIFQALPNVFANMPLGRLWGSLFFLFLIFAAFSTILAVFQNIISCVQELTGFSKRKTCLVCGIAVFILSIPCVLGFNVWSSFTPFGPDSAVLDLEDFIVSNILLPIGSLLFVLFVTTKKGWGFDNFMKEANQGTGLKVKKWMYYYIKYVLPVIIILLFVYGILDKFGVIKLIFS